MPGASARADGVFGALARLFSVVCARDGRRFVPIAVFCPVPTSVQTQAAQDNPRDSCLPQTGSRALPSRSYRCPCGGLQTRHQKRKHEAFAMHLARFRLKMQRTC